MVMLVNMSCCNLCAMHVYAALARCDMMDTRRGPCAGTLAALIIACNDRSQAMQRRLQPPAGHARWMEEVPRPPVYLFARYHEACGFLRFFLYVREN